MKAKNVEGKFLVIQGWVFAAPSWQEWLGRTYTRKDIELQTWDVNGRLNTRMLQNVKLLPSSKNIPLDNETSASLYDLYLPLV